MSKGKELIKNTGILFIGKISTQFVSFILLPLYTSKISTAEYGTLDLYTTIGGILIPILSLQLEQGIFRYLLTKEEDDISVVSSAGFFLVISSLLLTIVYLPISRIVGIEYSSLVLLYYISLLFCTVVQQVPRGYSDYTTYTMASFFSSTITIIFSVIFICLFNRGIDGILTASVLGCSSVTMFVFFKSKVYKKLRISSISWKCLKSLLKYSVPLVFNQLASWVVNYSDRVIIIAFLGISLNGVYAIANKFFSLLTNMLNIYNLAWTESVAKSLNDADRVEYHNRILKITTKLALLAATGATAGIGVMFKFFINTTYDLSYYQIPILVYAAMFSGLSANIGSIYIAYKKTKEISATTVKIAIINVIVHLSLIKFIGLYAASFSTLISFAVMCFYRIYKIKKIEQLDYNFMTIVQSFPLISIVLITYYCRYVVAQVLVLFVFFFYVIWYIYSQAEVKNLIYDLLKKRR